MRSQFIISLFVITTMLFSHQVLADPPSTGSTDIGLRGAGGMPHDQGLTPPFTFLGGGRYRDSNGYYAQMTGPDGKEKFTFEDPNDQTEAQDQTWQQHRGKFPGSYQEWKDLQQYSGANADLWGNFDNFIPEKPKKVKKKKTSKPKGEKKAETPKKKSADKKSSSEAKGTKSATVINNGGTNTAYVRTKTADGEYGFVVVAPGESETLPPEVDRVRINTATPGDITIKKADGTTIKLGEGENRAGASIQVGSTQPTQTSAVIPGDSAFGDDLQLASAGGVDGRDFDPGFEEAQMDQQPTNNYYHH